MSNSRSRAIEDKYFAEKEAEQRNQLRKEAERQAAEEQSRRKFAIMAGVER